jgi:Tfp pilus assembly protein PilF
VAGVELSEPQRRALDRMAYGELARSLAAAGRTADVARLLAREAAEAAKTTWAGEGVRRLALEDLLEDPGVLAAVVKAARQASGELPPAGRRLLAEVALYAGDDAAARDLDAKATRTILIGLPLRTRLEQRRHYAGAARVFAALMRDNKGQVGAAEFSDLANLHLQAGEFAAAREAATEAVKRAPADPAAEALLGEAEFQSRRFAAAREVFARWLKRNGAAALAPQVRLRLAAARYRLGEEDEAEKEFRQAAQGPAASREARQALALLLADRGKDLDAAEKLARESPTDAGGRFVLGAVLVARKQTKEGLKLMESALSDPYVSRQPEAYEWLGRARADAGDAEAAKAAWRKALELFPESADPKDPSRLRIERRLKEQQ